MEKNLSPVKSNSAQPSKPSENFILRKAREIEEILSKMKKFFKEPRVRRVYLLQDWKKVLLRKAVKISI